MNSKDVKKIFNKFWFLLWKDDSLKGWLFSVIFIFIFIKFIFFPSLGFVTGTELPLAIVESCSMYHKGDLLGNFNSWFERHENKYSDLSINKEDFDSFSFRKGFNKGDILFVIRANPEKIEVGDVIIFNANRQNPIIHRVVKIEEQDNDRIFSTLGDNNNGQLSFEKDIKENQLVGRPVFRLAPLAGWIKLIFFEHLKSESERGFCDEK